MHPSFLRVLEQRKRIKERLKSIKHKIGVYSAKGGVGKTTIAMNLAYTLSKKGFKVGLLDADVDCPNITMFLGIEGAKIDNHAPLMPVEHMGVKVISTGMLVDELKKPIIWRGPLVTKMLGDFFEYTDWGELDYLIVDLSPGLSDGPLTIMQLLDLDGFVLVTTPERVSSLNATRSGRMAKKLNMAVLGMVENMSAGKPSASTLEAAKELGTEVIGTVDRTQAIASATDSGKIQVMEYDNIAAEFDRIAERLIGR